MQIIETHAHIYSSQFDEDREICIQRAKENGVSHILMPNVDSDSIPKMLELEKLYPNYCLPMMGLHPCSVDENFEYQLELVESWLKKRKFCAIGEIGIDLHWDITTLEIQKTAFERQLDWALEYNLPVAIHARKANQEILETLEKRKNQGLKGVFHCFSGTLEEAKRAIDLGFYLGIGGVVTFKNGGLDCLIKEISIDHLILETDSPYLAPVPYRGKRNEPSYLDIVTTKLSELLEMNYSFIANKTSDNAKKLFGLDF